MKAEIIQYMRPNGRRVPQATELPDEVAAHYAAMQAKGWNLSGEVLMSGMVSVCIEDRQAGEDVNCRVISNGPAVQDAYVEMLKETFPEQDGVIENLNKPVLHVKHSELTRLGESQYTSECPVCKKGLLLVKRDDNDFHLLAEDRCIVCAQSVIYDDIEEMRAREQPTDVAHS